MTLSQLIAAAAANRRTVTLPDGTTTLYYLSSEAMETSIGRVVCFIDHTHKNRNSNAKHDHSRFDLNGKRIARAKLEQLLKDAA